MLLWLRHRPEAAAPIRPLAWELPYATGVALGEKKKFQKSQIRLLEMRPGPCIQDSSSITQNSLLYFLMVAINIVSGVSFKNCYEEIFK